MHGALDETVRGQIEDSDRPAPLEGRTSIDDPARTSRLAFDDDARATLERFVDRRIDRTSPRPSTGVEVPVTMDGDDCERTRTALRRLAADADAEPLRLAATALEVSLQDLLTFLSGAEDATTVEFDAGDCAVMALALLRVPATEDPDLYRQTGRTLFEDLRRSVPELGEGTTVGA